MSLSLYWQPLPKVEEPIDSGDHLKRAVARRFGGGSDGSLKEGPFRLSHLDLPWLEGVHDATASDEARAQAQRLIACIRSNPQGVKVWIGDMDDRLEDNGS